MSPLSTGVLTAFCVAAFIAFIVPFLKEGVAKNLKPQFRWADMKGLAVALLPFVVLFVGGQYLQMPAGDGLRYFAAAAILPFALSRLGFPARLTGLILLLASVLTTMWLDKEATIALNAMIAGLAVWKLCDNILSGTTTLDDVIPAFTWLGGLYWINAASPQALVDSRQAFLLGGIGVGVLMRVIQGPFIGSDKLYVKRVVLTLTAGLILLIYTTKLVVAPDLEKLAVLFGAGVFLTYLIEAIEKKSEDPLSAPEGVKILVMAGIFTLLAGRLFGTFGWLVLAPAALVATTSGAASIVGLFFLSRVMLQGFIFMFNSNVTGINITHPYAGAALYGGLLFALALSVLFRDVKERKVLLGATLAAAGMAPLAANYFVHAEATSSLLVAVTMSTLVAGVFAPVLYRQPSPEQGNLLLLPALMVAIATLSGQLIDMGNVSIGADKLTLLGYLAGASLVVGLALWWTTSRSGAKPVQVAGDQAGS